MKILSFAKCKTAIAVYLFSAVISCGYLITPVRESIAQAVQSVVGISIFNTPTKAWKRVETILSVDGLSDNPGAVPVIPLTRGTGSSFYHGTSLSNLTADLAHVPGFGIWMPDFASQQTAKMLTASAGYIDPCDTCAMLPVVPWLWNGTQQTKILSISATNLTAATSTGSQMTVPLSTWSVTHTPAAATQATISKAAGGGTVRHIATSITACSAQAGTAQTPIAVNLRNGATGAGTILRSWKLSTIIQDSKCVDLSGLAMIGSANTAMTIEFAAAGVAGSEQTVTLTGFSTP